MSRFSSTSSNGINWHAPKVDFKHTARPARNHGQTAHARRIVGLLPAKSAVVFAVFLSGQRIAPAARTGSFKIATRNESRRTVRRLFHSGSGILAAWTKTL